MILVETLRLRTWSIWWAAVIAAIGIVLVATVQHVHTAVVVNGASIGPIDVPLVTMAPVAMFLAMIYATSAGLSLNKEGQTLALSWTKPVPRPLVALRIIAVDAVAVAAAYAFAWLMIVVVIAGIGGSMVGSADLTALIALSLGVAIMWYALIAALTSAMPANTGVVVGFLWPVALILSSLHLDINPTIDLVLRLLNVINPLAYLNSTQRSSIDQQLGSYWQGPPDERAAIVWLLSCVLAAVAIGLWTRREA
jgi:hypothetical protein